MKRILILFLITLGLVGVFQVPAMAQGGQVTFTTLSAAVSDARTTTITVTSSSGMTATTRPGTTYYVYVDHELMLLQAISSTRLTVERGAQGTAATPHASGAHVFFGAAGSSSYLSGSGSVVTGGPFIASAPYGSCTRTAQPVLPVINVNTGDYYNCNGGKWLKQTSLADVPVTPLIGPCNVAIGSVAYGSFGTNTADVANKRMVTSIYVPRTVVATGVQFLQGGTATTDNITFGLFDASGNPIANAGATGVLLATADTFKSVPFTANASGSAQTTTIITGPALYFIGLNANGSTAGAIRTVAASTFKDVLSAGTTSITFGTFNSFTVPTTFTADLAPIACFYN